MVRRSFSEFKELIATGKGIDLAAAALIVAAIGAIIILTVLLAGCGQASSVTSQQVPPMASSPTPSALPTISPSPAGTSTVTPTPTSSSTPTPSVFASLFPLSGTGYRLPLTIRHISPRSAVLFFELDQTVEGYLFYQAVGGGAGGRLALSPDSTRQLLTLEDLTPGTTYDVRVGIVDSAEGYSEPTFLGDRWGPTSLQTPLETGELRFGVIGDASFGDSITASLVDEMADAELDFVLHTGDVVDETEADADPFVSYAYKYYDTFAPLLHQMPVYTVPGNHDYDADIRWQGAPFYYHAFPPFDDPLISSTSSSQYYAFSKGDLQFIMLDSQVFFGIPGREEQNQWLSERLADPRFRASIPVFHVSPFSSSSVHVGEGLPVRQAWVPLFEGANVPLVLSGHTHQYERLRVNTITYIVSGGGSSITYAGGEPIPGSLVFARKSHVVLVEGYPDSLELSSLSVEGELLDRHSVPLP